jgi:mRNA interferase YafQ
MYKLEFTHQYLKDLKLARKRKLDESKLNALIQLLLTGNNLPQKYKDHGLTGNMKGLNECHISPDWLLIYEKSTTFKLITLMRTGTHSDIF